MKYKRTALEPLAKSSDGWCLSHLNGLASTVILSNEVMKNLWVGRVTWMQPFWGQNPFEQDRGHELPVDSQGGAIRWEIGW